MQLTWLAASDMYLQRINAGSCIVQAFAHTVRAPSLTRGLGCVLMITNCVVGSCWCMGVGAWVPPSLSEACMVDEGVTCERVFATHSVWILD